MKQKTFGKIAKSLKTGFILSLFLVGTFAFGAYKTYADATPTPPAPCTDPKQCLINPIPSQELTQTFLLIIKSLLGIVGIWSVIFIIVGGFQMVMAAGSEETIVKAKKTITWAILGLVFALMSFSIVAIVQNILQIR